MATTAEDNGRNSQLEKWFDTAAEVDISCKDLQSPRVYWTETLGHPSGLTEPVDVFAVSIFGACKVDWLCIPCCFCKVTTHLLAEDWDDEEDSSSSDSSSNSNPSYCSRLSSPVNGKVWFSSTSINSIAKYTCNSGYTLSGSVYRKCLSTGEWYGSAPTCKRKSIHLPHS